MIKTVEFFALVLAWIFAIVMVFADKEHSMQWLIIMWVLVVGIRLDSKK